MGNSLKGVDILNPIQRSAAKMDIATPKNEFGKYLCFWGSGIDIQQVLPFASLAEIEFEHRLQKQPTEVD